MRYEVRVIADADMTTLGALVATADTLTEARQYSSSAYQFGVAIIDTEAGTCDWGHATTEIGEPAPAVEL